MRCLQRKVQGVLREKGKLNLGLCDGKEFQLVEVRGTGKGLFRKLGTHSRENGDNLQRETSFGVKQGIQTQGRILVILRVKGAFLRSPAFLLK